ncbi:MAG: ornithine cyclodeaminase family protein [Synergistaceae bacterium]|jgi:ornithine cyclodeaminase|nr:ornithine cyclodeaminase family protein [Synergistaceae bacterium]
MLVINAHQVRKLLPMKEAIEINKKAFLLHSAGQTEVPVRLGFDIPGRGSVLFMPAYVKGDIGSVGVKIVSVFPGNLAKGMTSVPAQMLLIDCETGVVKALMDGSEITRVRTGAISGAATDILARRDASAGALFGTGGQASAQLEAMLCARPLKEVRIFDLLPERTTTFIESNRELAEKYGAKLIAAGSSDEAIDGADMITAVTTSKTPVFDGTKVKRGAHVNGVGSFQPTSRELDEHLLSRARVFVDNREAVLAEAGDFLIPAAAGAYDLNTIAGEIGDVLAGRLAGRESDDEITVLKTVGYAVLDVAAAHTIYENAAATGTGTYIDL